MIRHTTMVWRSLALAIPLLIVQKYCYAEGLGEGADQQPFNIDTFQMLGRVIFALIVIIGLFFVIIKLLTQKNKWMSFGRSIRNLGGITLGQNKSLQIIEIGNALYLVGVGDNVQLLEKIDDPDEVAYITEAMLPNRKIAGPAAELTKWLDKLRNRRSPAADGEEEIMTSQFQDIFIQKMQNVSGRKKMIEDMLNESDAERSKNERSGP